MADRNASVAFTADTTQYTASLTQAIEITNKYSKSADTMLGHVAKLGGALTTALINKTAALTQTNKVATAQAAAYQQKLSGLEATSKILGEKTFPKLEKATKSLAATYPIGIDTAVEQMKALQESGVTQIKTVERMAKAYTQLGAATNSYGPEVGRSMTELTRSMGNGLEMVQGMGDSLTVLTKKFGGTAQGVLAFSKSIAPIATTVGMNQTQVMALSTSFARLGEDGYAAGNAINKVLMDIDRSVRNGSPELRQYAQVMNKSVEGLREQFKTDPFSVVTDFANAINAQGPNAIRTLNMLGLEGVRTTKAIATLSRTGDLPAMAREAASAYGGGAAGTAAQTAMGGVNDQLTRLNETMSQTVAGAGKPFLGFLEGVLKTSNSIAGAFNDIISSGFMQTVGKVGQTGGAVLGGLSPLITTATTLALAKTGMRAAREGFRDFGGGTRSVIAQDLIATGMGSRVPYFVNPNTPDTLSGRMGARYARARGFDATDVAMLTPVPMNIRGMVAGGARRMWNDANALAQFSMLSNENLMRSAANRERLTTPEGQKFLDAAAKARSSLAGGDLSGGSRQLTQALKDLERTTGLTRNALTTTAQRGMALTGASLRTIGGTAMGGLSALTGLGPAGLAAAGVAGLGIGAMTFRSNEKNVQERLADTSQSPYRLFNDFAEKTGYATRAVSQLGDAAAKAAKQIIAEGTTETNQYELTAEERTAAKAAGYAPGFTTTGNVGQDAITAALMGPMSPQETKRLVMDVYNQETTDYATQFATQLPKVREQANADLAGFIATQAKGANALNWSGGFGGDVRQFVTNPWGGGWTTEETAARKENIRDFARMSYDRDVNVGGKEYADRRSLTLIEDLLKKAPEMGAGFDVVREMIQSATGVDATTVNEAVTPGYGVDYLMAQAGPNSPMWKAWQAEQAGVPLSKSRDTPPWLEDAAKVDKSLSTLVGATIDLATIMDEGNKVASENNTVVQALTDQQRVGMSSSGKAIAEAQAAPDDIQTVTKSGVTLADNILRQVGGSFEKAQLSLLGGLATAPNDGTSAAIQSALSALSTNSDAMISMAKRSPMEQTVAAVQAGADAKKMREALPAYADEATVQGYRQIEQAGVQAQTQWVAQARAAAIQVRDSLKQMARAQTDYNISVARQERDYNRQRAWAKKDHAHAEMLAERDFRIQMAYTAEDYQRTVTRSEEDFQRTRFRAQRDFQRITLRNQESYTRSMRRAEEDYYRQRARAQEDHDKALRRSIEDNAKAMYDPYTRVQHNRVWDTRQLLRNVEEQNALLEKQMAKVEEMKKAGLSQAAVDFFDLANPENLQQALRTSANVGQDPTLIARMNAQAAERAALSSQFSTSENNVGFRRSEEDYATSMRRMGEDYATTTRRAAEDFSISMAQAAEDFAISMTDAFEDYTISMTRGEEEYQISLERANAQHKLQMEELDYQYKTQMARQAKLFRTAISDAADDFGKQKRRMVDDLTTAMTDITTAHDNIIAAAKGRIEKLPEKMREPLLAALDVIFGDITGRIDGFNADDEQSGLRFKYYDPITGKYETGGLINPPKIAAPDPLEVDVEFKLPKGWSTEEDKKGNVYIRTPGGSLTGVVNGGSDGHEYGEEDQGSTRQGGGWLDRAIGQSVSTPHNYGMRRHPVTGAWSMHTGVDLGLSGGTPLYAPFDGTMTTHSYSPAWAGNSVVFRPSNGGVGAMFAHMRGFSRGSGHVRRGERVGSVGTTGTSTGNHLHMEVLKSPYRPYSDAIEPYRYLAEGSILTKPTAAVMAEGGYPEAAIPLNERGARFMSDVLRRYVTPGEAKAAKVAPYSSTVTISTVTYDQRTQVSGPITVEANDPNELARRLEAKARRDRLTAPAGRR